MEKSYENTTFYTLFGFVHINSGKHNEMNRFEEEENVEENNGWKNGTNRSLSQHIFIRTEGNLLLLSTDKQIDDFSIQIKDAQGHIVYTEAHLSLPAKGVYPILIGDWTNGLYTVTLCQDGKYAIYQFTK